MHVAELPQYEGLQRPGRMAKVIRVQPPSGLHDSVLQAAQDPPVLLPYLRRGVRAERFVHHKVLGKETHGELHDVPHLVTKVAVRNDLVHVEVDLIALASVRAQREAHRVRAALGNTVRKVLFLALDGLGHLARVEVALPELFVQVLQADAFRDVDGVQHVTERLAHLAPVRIPHHGMQVDRAERKCVHQEQAHHHHASHPEEQNVFPRLHELNGEERLEVRRFPGPAEHREGKEPRAEPRIQHVRVLLKRQLLGLALELGPRALVQLRLVPRHDPASVQVGVRPLFALGPHQPRVDTVPPPQLPRETPRLAVLHPAEPRDAVGLGDDLQLAVPHGRNRSLGDVLDVHPPLGLEHGLDDVPATLAESEVHGVAPHAVVPAFGGQILANAQARLVAGQTRELRDDIGNAPVVGQHIEELQLGMTLCALIVVGIVGRGDLDASRPKVHLHQLAVQHDREPYVPVRVMYELAVEVPVALVIRVDGHRRVRQHRLQPGRGDAHHRRLSVRPGHRGAVLLHHVVPEILNDTKLHRLLVARNGDLGEGRHVYVLNLNVRDGRLERAAPVAQALRAVDNSHIVQAEERLPHRCLPVIIQRERRTVPVERRAQPPQLLENVPALLLLPRPHMLEELIPPQVVAGLPQLPLDPLLHYHLRRDARVVRSRDPQHLLSVHPVVATEHVLHRVCKSMPHMEIPSHVGGRNDHNELLLVLVAILCLGRKEAALFPPVIPGRLHPRRTVAIG
mmetsp:Transcript_6006/g.16951  ORF Transcript_6006/g.16951 Transcript_6006/m.16951 type:complete len:738 (+) Transcript_6006:755-2968(+)